MTNSHLSSAFVPFSSLGNNHNHHHNIMLPQSNLPTGVVVARDYNNHPTPQLFAFLNPAELTPPVNPHPTSVPTTFSHLDPTLASSSSNQNNPLFWQSDAINTVHGSALARGVREWLVPSANAATTTKPPTDAEVKLLREALGALFGERNPEKAEELLTQAIAAWERQPPDERAALYRVRGDCYTGLMKAEEAVKDYTIAIDLLDGPGGELADPEEKPAARLGRARALRSMGKITKEQFEQAATDYQISLRLSSREDWDTDEENEQDGASRNPYAAWEWGMARRGAGDFTGAAETHALASLAFKDIGDRARSVISALDAGIDLAATDDVSGAKKALEEAIKRTTSVEGNDIELLQRVIAKEGEARIALASVLWGANEKGAAEGQLGEACTRLDQLEADADAREAARVKSGAMPSPKINKLSFTIDDAVGPGQISCSRFKNEKFLNESLMWPESLQKKVVKLNNLGK